MKDRRPWTEDDIAKLESLARRRPTVEIAKELGRGYAATVMKAHQRRISLRLKPKQGSREANAVVAVHKLIDKALAPKKQ
jgi:hypothetical protein